MLVMCVYGPYFNLHKWFFSAQNMFFLAVQSANRLLGEGEYRSEVYAQ